MKKRILIAAVLALALLLAACGGQAGWLYDLPNGYTLHCVDGQVCVEKDGEQALSYGVTAFCTGARYVGLKQLTGETETWFILDTENSVFYSAENETDWNDICESFQITDLGAWTSAEKAPSGSYTD